MSISKDLISKVKCEKENLNSKAVNVEKRGRKSLLNKQKIMKLKNMLKSVNPPTQNSLATGFSVSRGCIQFNIKKLWMKKVKKRRGHALSEGTIKKRLIRSWPLYLRLRHDRWRNSQLEC